MAKHKHSIVRYVKAKARHHKHGFTLPIAVVAGFTPGLSRMWYHFNNPGESGASSGIEAVGTEAGRIYLGYDPRDGSFTPYYMTFGTLPIVIGWLIHKFVGGKLGVNKMLSQAGIPILRL